MSRPLAVLRPEPGNAATADRIEGMGLATLRLPMFVVGALDWAPPDADRYDALLLTSANALRHGGAGLDAFRHLPVHAVGAATAAAARSAGFAVAAVGSGGAADLDLPARSLHLAGREHRPLPGVEVIAVYASDPLSPDLSPLGGAVALVHSPRAAARLALLAPVRGTIRVAAISRAAADAAGSGWQDLMVADAPRDVALIAAARRLAD